MITELAFWMLRRRRPWRVSGRSMEPHLLDGQLLLIDPALSHGPLAVGDMIVCRHPHKSIDLVKFVAAIDEDLISLESPGGDDSRQFGRVSTASVKGRVTANLSAWQAPVARSSP